LGGMVLVMMLVEGGIMPYAPEISTRNPNFRNIREVRQLKQVDDLNLYSIAEEEFRIELVWEVGREVKAWSFQQMDQLPESRPFVLFSSTAPKEILPEEILKKFDLLVLGQYDYNRNNRGKKKSKPHFIKYVSVLSPKTELTPKGEISPLK